MLFSSHITLYDPPRYNVAFVCLFVLCLNLYLKFTSEGRMQWPPFERCSSQKQLLPSEMPYFAVISRLHFSRHLRPSHVYWQETKPNFLKWIYSIKFTSPVLIAEERAISHGSCFCKGKWLNCGLMRNNY